jgi:hypothetical protein
MKVAGYVGRRTPLEEYRLGRCMADAICGKI